VPCKDPHGSYRLPKGDAARQRHPIPLPASGCQRPDRLLHDAHVRHALPREWDRAPAHQALGQTARSNA
jgi:hypothetical protein